MTAPANPYGWLPIGWLLQLTLCVVLLLAAWASVPTPVPPMDDAELPAVGTPELLRLVETGHRLAIADCMACHSASPARPFAGGVALTTPLGRIYSTNISPDAEAGIGRYSLHDFDRALRHGIAREGWTLHPAARHPDPARRPSDAETKALYAFLVHGVAAAPDADRPPDIAWPLSMRWPLAIWRKAIAPSVDARPPLGDRG